MFRQHITNYGNNYYVTGKKKMSKVAVNHLCSLLITKISLNITRARIFSWKHFTLHGFIGSSSIFIAMFVNKAYMALNFYLWQNLNIIQSDVY